MPETDVRARTRHAPSTGSSIARLRGPRAATQIHAALHADIVHMRLKPLDILNEKQLGERFGVSRTPVREALLRLSDEGLVDIYPQSGTFVARIPRRALFEAILIRKALEATTVTLAIAGANSADLKILEENQAQLIACAAAGDIARFHSVDSAFHQNIAELAGYPGIWSVIQQVQVQIDRYRYITLPRSGRLDVVIEEHAAIIAGISRRDDTAAVAAMEIHIGRMLDELDDIQDLDPAIFIDDRQP